MWGHYHHQDIIDFLTPVKKAIRPLRCISHSFRNASLLKVASSSIVAMTLLHSVADKLDNGNVSALLCLMHSITNVEDLEMITRVCLCIKWHRKTHVTFPQTLWPNQSSRHYVRMYSYTFPCFVLKNQGCACFIPFEWNGSNTRANWHGMTQQLSEIIWRNKSKLNGSPSFHIVPMMNTNCLDIKKCSRLELTISPSLEKGLTSLRHSSQFDIASCYSIPW